MPIKYSIFSVDGEVLFRVFWPHTNHQTEFKVRDDELESIVVDDMKINMPTGRITLQVEICVIQIRPGRSQ